MTIRSENDLALAKVEWALSEAYKIAVHLRGVTDWSTEKPETSRLVEKYQIQIAEMILGKIP